MKQYKGLQLFSAYTKPPKDLFVLFCGEGVIVHQHHTGYIGPKYSWKCYLECNSRMKPVGMNVNFWGTGMNCWGILATFYGMWMSHFPFCPAESVKTSRVYSGPILTLGTLHGESNK